LAKVNNNVPSQIVSNILEYHVVSFADALSLLHEEKTSWVEVLAPIKAKD
jgi:hypothetical protein